MRVNSTVTWVTREVLEDFTFEGLDIAAGITVHLFSLSAGTDPRAFPDRGFDIEAERKPHYGFGGGVHHCLGHFVARSADHGQCAIAAPDIFRIDDEGHLVFDANPEEALRADAEDACPEQAITIID